MAVFCKVIKLRGRRKKEGNIMLKIIVHQYHKNVIKTLGKKSEISFSGQLSFLIKCCRCYVKIACSAISPCCPNLYVYLHFRVFNYSIPQEKIMFYNWKCCGVYISLGIMVSIIQCFHACSFRRISDVHKN